jgi:hypothetical protein
MINRITYPSNALALNHFSDDYDIPFCAVAKSGTTNSGGAGTYQLVDTTSDFVRLGIKIGMMVWNIDMQASAIITNVSVGILDIDSDIFTSSGEEYRIFSQPNPGALIISSTKDKSIRVTTLGGDTVVFNNVPINEFIPVLISRVWQSGTTADPPTSIIALW